MATPVFVSRCGWTMNVLSGVPDVRTHNIRTIGVRRIAVRILGLGVVIHEEVYVRYGSLAPAHLYSCHHFSAAGGFPTTKTSAEAQNSDRRRAPGA
jgi:hypothetical protein